MSTETTDRVGALDLLRKPFPAENIAKLPKVNCRNCSQGNGTCQQHPNKRTCKDCGNWITPGHIHLDYVGHAETTDRLLDADLEWSWEPLALTPQGLPQFDEFNGMWIRLTVAGVTRIGYGAASPNKRGPDAIKEIIGDAIRNAGMRFGVALDLWAKTDLHADEREQEPEEPQERPAQREDGRADDQWATAGPALATSEQVAMVMEGLRIVRGAETPEAQRTAIAQILKRPFAEGERLTRPDAERVRLALVAEEEQAATLARQEAAKAERAAADRELPPPSPMVPTATAEQIGQLANLLGTKRSTEQRAWNAILSAMLERTVTDVRTLSRAEATSVIERLKLEPGLGAPVPAGPMPNDPEATKGRQRMMHALFREKGIGDDGKHPFIARVLGHDIETMAKITRSQCDAVIEALNTGAIPAGAPDNVPTDSDFEFQALTQMVNAVHNDASRVAAQQEIDAEAAAGNISADDRDLLRERLAEVSGKVPAGVAS